MDVSSTQVKLSAISQQVDWNYANQERNGFVTTEQNEIINIIVIEEIFVRL